MGRRRTAGATEARTATTAQPTGAGRRKRAGGRRRIAARVAGAGLLLLPTVVLEGIDPAVAFADPSAPPPFASLGPNACPGPTNPAKGAAADATPVHYGVPFRAIVFGGTIKLPPSVVVPHFYASLCGEIGLPDLIGTLSAGIATPNIYVGGLEAFPATVTFPSVTTKILAQPAPNGGLDLAITGTAVASVTTVGMTCSVDMPVDVTTKTAGSLTGAPVTGPTQQGQAVVVGDAFPVPAITGSDSGKCPPAVAQALNKLLDLPAPAGRASFSAPLCFDFELESTAIPKATKNCPWPAS